MPTYSRTDRVGELYERRFYAKAWGDRPKRNGRIAMRDLLIEPKGHEGPLRPRRREPAAERAGPDPAARGDDAQHGPQLALRGDVRGRAAAAGDGRPGRPRGRGQEHDPRAHDAGTTSPRPAANFPLGGAVASSACFPGGFPPMVVPGLFDDLTVELVDGGVHDNQGVEGLVDRGCTHRIISDGSGQMPDIAAPLDPPARRARPRDLDLRRRRARAAAAAAPARGRRRPASCTCRPACPRVSARPAARSPRRRRRSSRPTSACSRTCSARSPRCAPTSTPSARSRRGR